MKPIDVYSRSKQEVQSIYRSRLQIQILLSLGEGAKTLSQLREITGSTSQAVLPKIRKLELNQFIETKNYEYTLTPLGQIVRLKIEDFVMSTAVIHEHREFWAGHYLDGIPQELLEGIGDLYDTKVIADTNVDIFNVYGNFVRMLAEADRIWILSPVTSLGHTDAVLKRVVEGAEVEMVITSDLAQQLATPPYRDKTREFSGYERGKIWVYQSPLKVGLTVTNKALSLGLYKRDTITYDTTTDLLSHDPKAIAWGDKLFAYFRDKSVRLTA